MKSFVLGASGYAGEDSMSVILRAALGDIAKPRVH
jgi:hypothetical protein